MAWKRSQMDEFTILLPIDNAELFVAKFGLHDQPLVSWQAYRLMEGESIVQVATKFGLSVETLRTINGLGGRARVHGGHLLLVPAERPSSAADASLSRAVLTVAPQGRTFYHAVRRGETLYSIARHYRVSTDELREWNRMPSAVRVSQQVRVTSDVVPSASPRGRSTRHSRSAATGGAKSIRAPAKATKPQGAAATPARGNPAPSGKAAGTRAAHGSPPTAREPGPAAGAVSRAQEA